MLRDARAFIGVASVACLLLMVGAGPAQAVPTISFDPSTTVVGVGDTFSIDVVITGLDPGVGIGDFDLDITLSDPALITFDPSTGVLMSSFLGDPGDPLETLNCEAEGDCGYAGGVIDIDNTSFLDPAVLVALQAGGSGILATLTFEAALEGTLLLSFDPAAQVTGDQNGGPLSVQFGRGSVCIGPCAAAVPEPATGLLVLAGLAVVAGMRARARR